MIIIYRVSSSPFGSGNIKFSPKSSMEDDIHKCENLKRYIQQVRAETLKVEKVYDGRWSFTETLKKPKTIIKDEEGIALLVSATTPCRNYSVPWNMKSSETKAAFKTPAKNTPSIDSTFSPNFQNFSPKALETPKKNDNVGSSKNLSTSVTDSGLKPSPRFNCPTSSPIIPNVVSFNGKIKSSRLSMPTPLTSQSSPLFTSDTNSENYDREERKKRLKQLAFRKSFSFFSSNDKENYYNDDISASTNEQSLFLESKRGHKDGFKNMGQTCYVAAILQLLFYSPLKGSNYRLNFR